MDNYTCTFNYFFIYTEDFHKMIIASLFSEKQMSYEDHRLIIHIYSLLAGAQQFAASKIFSQIGPRCLFLYRFWLEEFQIFFFFKEF